MNSFALPPTVLPAPISASARSAKDVEVKSNGETRGIVGFISEVASLSTPRIMEMTGSELAEVICKVRLGHLRPGVLEQLSRMDGTTLRRLVFATRRYCRDQALVLDGIPAGLNHCPR